MSCVEPLRKKERKKSVFDVGETTQTQNIDLPPASGHDTEVDSLTVFPLEVSRRQIAEQEVLIRAYQAENEEAVRKIKVRACPRRCDKDFSSAAGERSPTPDRSTRTRTTAVRETARTSKRRSAGARPRGRQKNADRDGHRKEAPRCSSNTLR